MRKIKSFNILVVLALFMLLTSCGTDHDCEPNERKQIYGTFAGTITQIETRLSTSEVISNLTESATLDISKVNGKMDVTCEGERTHLFEIAGLPALDVSGHRDYSYSFKADDGSMEIKILSPDFEILNYEEVYVSEEYDIKFEISFKGKRI